MTTHRSGSYVYNAICDVCGWQFKSTELRQRWDGYMVCDKDWETRNILDFYRPRNDNHKLPWTRSDTTELTWTPIFTNLTGSIDTKTGTYKQDTINNIINFWVQVNVTTSGTTSTSGAEVSIPVQSVAIGTTRVFDSRGNFLGSAAIGASVLTAALPDWPTNTSNIIISGKYGV